MRSGALRGDPAMPRGPGVNNGTRPARARPPAWPTLRASGHLKDYQESAQARDDHRGYHSTPQHSRTADHELLLEYQALLECHETEASLQRLCLALNRMAFEIDLSPAMSS